VFIQVIYFKNDVELNFHKLLLKSIYPFISTTAFENYNVLKFRTYIYMCTITSNIIYYFRIFVKNIAFNETLLRYIYTVLNELLSVLPWRKSFRVVKCYSAIDNTRSLITLKTDFEAHSRVLKFSPCRLTSVVRLLTISECLLYVKVLTLRNN